MRFLHTADLHIGKSVNEFSMLKDQEFILKQISGIAQAEEAEAVVMAGDIYDRAIPPAEAVALFDAFLTELAKKGIQVIMISGNHDSPERLSFGESIMGKQGVTIAGVYREELSRLLFREKDGEIEFVLLPFTKPAQAGAKTSSEAVKKLLDAYWEKEEAGNGNKAKRRVLVTHYFVTDSGKEPELSDSETTIHVGSLDNVEASLFEGFDYVALGHIHKPQRIGERQIYYAGAPLKYSFGEVKRDKSVFLVDMGKEGVEEVRSVPLRPLHEMRKVRGSLKEILEQAACEGMEREDYIEAVLTDKGGLIDPIGTLRSVYPNIMQIVREEKEGLERRTETKAGPEKKEIHELFQDFYRIVRGEPLQEEGKRILLEMVKELEHTEGKTLESGESKAKRGKTGEQI